MRKFALAFALLLSLACATIVPTPNDFPPPPMTVIVEDFPTPFVTATIEPRHTLQLLSFEFLQCFDFMFIVYHLLFHWFFLLILNQQIHAACQG